MVRMRESLQETLKDIIIVVNKHENQLAPKYDDLRFPATTSKIGANSKPDFDYTNLGLLFPQNIPTEKIYIIGQMPHGWVEESTIYPHIHYTQDEAEVPVFKLSYRFTNNGAAEGEWTTITSTTLVFTYTSGSLRQILRFPSIDMTGIKVSAIVEAILWREDNVVTGDVLYKELDFHYQIDSNGSEEQFVK